MKNVVDENLMRSELTVAERAQQTARRKQLYEARYPETAHGATKGNQRTGKVVSRQVGDSNRRFTKATAKAIGKSERSVQRDAERGEKIHPNAPVALVSTSLQEQM